MTDQGHDYEVTLEGSMRHSLACFLCASQEVLGPDGPRMIGAFRQWWVESRSADFYLTPEEAARVAFFAGIAWGLGDIKRFLSQKISLPDTLV